MHPLFQRLKEQDPKRFELLCFLLIKERHPTVDIRHVDGKAGDEGIDVFSGELIDGPTVWQCKAFPDGIKESQKGQIRESLSRALGTCSPKRWILCTNVDLDSQALRWYQDRMRERAGQCVLGLMQASDIISHLAQHRTLCDEFFPEARMDVAGLRSLLMGTNKMTDTELATLTEETMDQLLLRYKAMDARFNYEVGYARDRVRDKPAQHAGEMFSITKGSTTIRGYPRDIEALRTAPPKTEFTFRGEGIRKALKGINTGEQQDFAPGEIVSFHTDLLPMSELMAEDPSTLSLQWIQNVGQHDPVALRLTFGHGATSVVYDYVAFRFERIGKEEFELVSTTKLPFTMSLVFRDKEGLFKFTEEPYKGADVRGIRKFMDAIHAVSTTQDFEAFALEEGKRLFQARAQNLKVPPHWSGFETLVRSIAEIADAFDVNLCLPSQASENDEEALHVLKAILSESPIRLGSPSIHIIKVPESVDSLLATLAKGTAVGVRYTLQNFSIDLFGTTVPVGTLLVELGTVSIQDLEATCNRWRDANISEAVEVTFGPAENAILRRVR